MQNFEERDLFAEEIGAYIVETGTTIRSAAIHFNMSKSNLHYLMVNCLRKENPQLYAKVREVLDFNKSQRHIRGGESTRRKFKGDN